MALEPSVTSGQLLADSAFAVGRAGNQPVEGCFAIAGDLAATATGDADDLKTVGDQAAAAVAKQPFGDAQPVRHFLRCQQSLWHSCAPTGAGGPCQESPPATHPAEHDLPSHGRGFAVCVCRKMRLPVAGVAFMVVQYTPANRPVKSFPAFLAQGVMSHTAYDIDKSLRRSELRLAAKRQKKSQKCHQITAGATIMSHAASNGKQVGRKERWEPCESTE